MGVPEKISPEAPITQAYRPVGGYWKNMQFSQTETQQQKPRSNYFVIVNDQIVLGPSVLLVVKLEWKGETLQSPSCSETPVFGFHASQAAAKLQKGQHKV